MTDADRDALRTALEKATVAFFRKRAHRAGIGARVDATVLIQVLSEWGGDLIADAPQEMQEPLFDAFAGTAAEIAGLVSDECDCEECMREAEHAERPTLQ